MTAASESKICLRVDPTNPGQFFACCGLLELADRLWGGAEGWFEDSRQFNLQPVGGKRGPLGISLLKAVGACQMSNAMTTEQRARRDELSMMPKKLRDAAPDLRAEKQELDALWREAPIIFHSPFDLRVDWFLDERSGGSDFKTWAGQQSVFDIAEGMRSAIRSEDWAAIACDDWLFRSASTESLPFNFDSALGALGTDLDVGFSFDPLKHIQVLTRPLLELGAFVGLQRYRPMRLGKENRFRFTAWSLPLNPTVASAAACGLIRNRCDPTFEFRLLYRTKYLKSFLPANMTQGE